MAVALGLSALFEAQEAQRLVEVTHSTSEATCEEVRFLFDVVVRLRGEVQALQVENAFLSSWVAALEDESGKRRE